jgi:hypothetical protein
MGGKMPTRIPSSSVDLMSTSLSKISAGIAPVLILLTAGLASACATEVRITCPVKLDAQALRIAAPAGGWTIHVPVGLWLHSAAPMDGPPSEMVTLQGEIQSTKGKSKTTRWMLKQDASDGGVHEKWMACFYGAGNDVIMSKRIDDAVTECSVTYTKQPDPARDKVDIRCK